LSVQNATTTKPFIGSSRLGAPTSRPRSSSDAPTAGQPGERIVRPMLESSLAETTSKKEGTSKPALFKATMNDARLFRNLIGAISSLIEDANKKLNITLKNKIVRKFITPTLEPSTEEVPTPKVPFNARVKITAVSLRDIIDDAQSISDNVKLEVSPEKFTVRATGELSSAI